MGPINSTCSEKIAVFEEDRDDENQKDSHDQNQNYHRKHARAATLANVIHTEPEVTAINLNLIKIAN